MPELTKLERFLESKVVTEKGKPFTHTTMAPERTQWFIGSDDLETFYKLYCEQLRQCVPQYLTEKSSPIGSLRVDLDFKYKGRLDEHKHTQQQVTTFVSAYMAEVKKFLTMPDIVEVFVLEKSQPVYEKTHDTSKSGIHIQVPALKTNSGVEKTVRRNLLKRMEEFFPNLGFMGDWEHAYDSQPLTHTNNWMILGSKKQDGYPYEIKYLLDWDSETGEMSIDDSVPYVTPEIVRKLSIRAAPSEETAMTEYGKENIHIQVQQDAVVGPGRSVSRGRQDAKGEPGSRGSSPGGRVYVQPLSEHMREYYSAHTMNLAENRYTDYQNWINVGICLKNIHPDLHEVWFDFGGQYDKFNQREAVAKWNSFSSRSDGEKLGVGSLRGWSAADNLEQYLRIENDNVDRIVEESALTQTEYDVALVVFAKYKDEFKCAKFGVSEWYRFDGHIWKWSDRGVSLQCRLSSDIAKIYLAKEMEMMREISVIGTCPHKVPDSTCDVCKAETKKKAYNSIRLKLKRTGFKKSVMDECKELFLDEEFGRKLDENKNLIAFNNGVFDTVNMVFRDGKPEDCISLTTEIDYDSERRYDTHECWGLLNKFLCDVLPDRVVRDYFMRHLSTCLVGGNDGQKFHILTGSGSNGKSMLMNLVFKGFGKYSCKVPISLLTQKRNKSAAASPEIVKMKGCRFVTMQEPDEGEPLSTGLMKEMVSSETMVARDLFAGSKAMVEFEPPKMHLTCNEKPKITTTDGGTWRRLVVVNFPSKFVAEPKAKNEKPMDDTIVQKTQTEEWATAFMAYLVQLFIEGNGWRKLAPPEKAMEHTNEYKEENDVVARFIREQIHSYPEGEVSVDAQPVLLKDLNIAFTQWKRENEVAYSATPAQMVKRIEEAHGKFKRGGWTSFRLGTF
jgi:P4 family phage/plasmid primase-like protien